MAQEIECNMQISHLKGNGSVYVPVCHQHNLCCVMYCSLIITLERLPHGPESSPVMNSPTKPERAAKEGRKDRIRSPWHLMDPCLA